MTFDDDFKMTIGGEQVESIDRFDVLNPATEQKIAQAPDASAAQLDDAVGAARRAFAGWRATPFAARAAILKQIGDRIREYKDALIALLISEHGKAMPDAAADVLGSAYWFDEFAEMRLPVELIEDGAERRLEVRREPVGVVAALAPWNFPLILAAMKAAPALLAGNTVILKPSPFTPLSTLKLVELINDLLPPGVLNVVTGGDHLGPLITAHPGIDKISFTGSSATGRRVMRSASETLKRLTLELGGNDAAIIMPDVDVAAVAKQIFRSAFGNCGQVCVAAKRVYVHDDIYDRFAEQMVENIRAAKLGEANMPGVKFGPVQNRQQFERVRELIDDVKANGYKILIGGDIPDAPGYFIPLTLIDNPPDQSRIVQEEQFGPVLPLLRFSDLDDVISRVNDSPYGLGGQIWSSDEDAAYDLAARFETGNVWINQSQAIYPQAPFGGHKSSGLGVESSQEGLLAFTNAKTIVINRRATSPKASRTSQ